MIGTLIILSILLGLAANEVRVRGRYCLYWVCPCGKPSRRTVYWDWSCRYVDAYRKKYREDGMGGRYYAVKYEKGRPKYDVCPRCGRDCLYSLMFPVKLKGLPFRRRVDVSIHVHKEYREWLDKDQQLLEDNVLEEDRPVHGEVSVSKQLSPV